MKEKICCFCGHRCVVNECLDYMIEHTLTDLIEKRGYNTFYSGGMGEFDELCEKIVRRLKNKYPHIKLCRVLYCYKRNIDKTLFDEIIVPWLEGIHYKKLIIMKNRWMVEKADAVLCYVNKDYGGAYSMMQYAQKLEKSIVYML